MAAIVLIRSDIPAGVLQVTDLWPNASQRNQIYDPQPQGPAYLSSLIDDQTAAVATVVSGANRVTTAAFSGLAAYLLDNVVDNSTPADALTAAQANTAADSMIAEVKNGGALTLTAINDGAVNFNGDDMLPANFFATAAQLVDILNILAGAVYNLPSGSAIAVNASSNKLSVKGSFANAGVFREVFATNSLIISAKAGILKTLSSSSFSYKGVTGAAVVVYDDAGNVL